MDTLNNLSMKKSYVNPGHIKSYDEKFQDTLNNLSMKNVT